MGFFTDLKVDLNQVSKSEQSPEDNRTKEEQEEELKSQQMLKLEEMLQNIPEEDLDYVSAPAIDIVETEEIGGDVPQEDEEAYEYIEDDVKEEIGLTVEEVPQEVDAIFEEEESGEPEEFVGINGTGEGERKTDKSWMLNLEDMEKTNETAVITAGMRIKGDVLSNGSLDVLGQVYGNVQVKGKLNVTGKIVGNSMAEEVFVDAAKVVGDIVSVGEIKIETGTVIRGNVEATSATIAGAVKGTIDINGPVVLDSTAVILGNIRAKSMQINNGARIDGMCVLCYAEQSAAKFFEEQEDM